MINGTDELSSIVSDCKVATFIIRLSLVQVRSGLKNEYYLIDPARINTFDRILLYQMEIMNNE